MTQWNYSKAVVTNKHNPEKVYKGAAALFFDSLGRPTVIQVTMSPDEKVTLAAVDYEIAHN